MPKPTSAARVPDDEDASPDTIRPVERASLVPARIEPPRRPSGDPAPLTRLQNNCYEALSLALKEGQVFAAVTGPARAGKTRVLDAVLADWHDRTLRCIRISEPEKVPARLAAHIETTAYAEAAKPENLERHIVLAIDNAHLATDDLLVCINRLAQMREPGRRVPQVLLVGRPELWTRLSAEQYAPLARRLAIRGTLPAFEEDAADPWATVEQEVSQLRTEGAIVPIRPPEPERSLEPIYESAYAQHYEPQYPSAIDPATLALDEATVPPPSMYALFPDPAPAAPAAAAESRRRLLLPIGCLAVTVVAFVLVLSLYDWPDLFGDMPWSQTAPATPFNLTPPKPAQSHTLPQTPSWSQTEAKPASPPASPTPKPAVTATVSSPPPAPEIAKPPTPAPAPKPVVAATTPSNPPPANPTPVVPEAPKPTSPAPVVEAAKPAPPLPPVVEPARPITPEPPRQVVEASKPAVASPALPPVVESFTPPQSSDAAPAADPSQPPANAQFAAIPVPPVPPPPPATFTPITVQPSTPAPTPPPRSNPASAPRPATAPTVVTAAPLPPAIVALLLRRGDEQVAIGDLSAARLLYERAAEAGSATAALRLARTFDPELLPAADARAFGDRAQARSWYTKAAALGSREAVDRVRSTNGR